MITAEEWTEIELGVAQRARMRCRRSCTGTSAARAASPFDWVELDPTNDTRVAGDHIAVAWGRDFGDVSPLRGVILGGGTHDLSVRVSVAAVNAP